MTNYRFYFLRNDHIVRALNEEAANDEEAAVIAQRLAKEDVVEVWDHARKVCMISPFASRIDNNVLNDRPGIRSTGVRPPSSAQVPDVDERESALRITCGQNSAFGRERAGLLNEDVAR